MECSLPLRPSYQLNPGKEKRALPPVFHLSVGFTTEAIALTYHVVFSVYLPLVLPVPPL